MTQKLKMNDTKRIKFICKSDTIYKNEWHKLNI